MNTYDINSNQQILEELIDKALLNTVRWITGRGKPQEPDYVAALSNMFLKDLFYILAAVFPNYDFSVSGVYCHQKPIVDINMDKKPELGDILFVYADRKRNGTMLLNSLLLQAKISNKLWLKVHKNERHQLELYKNWPEFTYCGAGYLNGEKRNILPKTINNGAQYLLIDNDPITNGCLPLKGAFPMGCAVPDDILYISNTLSQEIVNLFKFKSGRPFERNPYSTEDGWSKMIWDLLKISAVKFSKRKNTNLQSFPRFSEYDHFCTDHDRDISLLDETFKDFEYTNKISDENSGISLVLVESFPKEEYDD